MSESDWFDGVAHTVERPRDIVRTLDYAEALNADGALAGLIDLDNVAVVGHSYGGYTALAAAARRSTSTPSANAAAHWPRTTPRCSCVRRCWARTPSWRRQLGLADAPAGLWPSMGDPRVDAIVPMAGDAFLFDEDGLANVTVPMMAIGGTADTGTPFDWGSGLAYDYAGSAQKSLVGLAGRGAHDCGQPLCRHAVAGEQPVRRLPVRRPGVGQAGRRSTWCTTSRQRSCWTR